jgi:hypothetical protein
VGAIDPERPLQNWKTDAQPIELTGALEEVSPSKSHKLAHPVAARLGPRINRVCGAEVVSCGHH